MGSQRAGLDLAIEQTTQISGVRTSNFFFFNFYKGCFFFFFFVGGTQTPNKNAELKEIFRKIRLYSDSQSSIHCGQRMLVVFSFF